MNNFELSQQRLINQRISATNLTQPEEVVRWLGAVQAQDYFGAQWALGMRMKNAHDAAIEQAFMEGKILRTHVLRPTWHFVTPEDIRWLLKITAPRVHAASAYMYRKNGMDEDLFRRSRQVLEQTLQGGKMLTREELEAALNQAGIQTAEGERLVYFMMNAELEGVICSGPRRGKQFTYTLLDERVPYAHNPSREEALAELSKRYFASRGPASLQDFAKWSGLTIADCKAGLDEVQSQFEQASVNGQTYWFSAAAEGLLEPSAQAYLLSVYDEYISGYRDRSNVCEPRIQEQLSAMGNGLNNVIVIRGQICGSWRRSLKTRSMQIELAPLRQLDEAEKDALFAAAERYATFFQIPKQNVQISLQMSE